MAKVNENDFELMQNSTYAYQAVATVFTEEYLDLESIGDEDENEIMGIFGPYRVTGQMYMALLGN